jgi:hypothetical protein
MTKMVACTIHIEAVTLEKAQHIGYSRSIVICWVRPGDSAVTARGFLNTYHESE